VIFAEWHPAYGKMVEIDHGNRLVSRYAHTSMMFVKEGDLVVRGQRIATVGSTGRLDGSRTCISKSASTVSRRIPRGS
jgi:murein DD-endopeptidase MepM/ murein hydrolase activator NlpD